MDGVIDTSSDPEIVGILKPGLPGAVNSPGLKPRMNGGIYGLH
jgi:hypothetical protein